MINPDGVRHQIHGNVIQSTSRALMEEVSFDRQCGDEPRMGRLSHHHLSRRAQDRRVDAAAARTSRRSASANPRPFRAPRRSPMRSSTRPACAFASRRSRRNAFSRACAAKSTAPTHCPARAPSPAAIRHMAKSVCRAARRVRDGRGPLRRRDRHRRRHAAVAIDRADRAAGCLGVFRRHHRPRPATRRARRLRGLPHRRQRRAQCGRPAAAKRRSARSTSTNITPDVETGIGAWSYPAFERAMREGIHRDGRHLYPAFPYTHFAKTNRRRPAGALCLSDGAGAGARRRSRTTGWRFRSTCGRCSAGGTRCSIRPSAFQPDPAKSEVWNRGAYLVEGLGHCSACHSPRNALGAEQQHAYLAGGFAEGWEAPAADLAFAGADPVERGRAFRLFAHQANPAFTASPPDRWRRW